MSEIGVKCLCPGDDQEHGAQRNEADDAVGCEEFNAVRRIECPEHRGILHDMPNSGDGDSSKPDQHDRAEECGHSGRAARLKREEHHQNERGKWHHVRLESRSGDLESLNRGEHGKRRRNHRVAIEQRGTDDAAQHQGARAFAKGTLCQSHQRQRAAFTVIVRPQQDEDVFECDNQNERPDDQRQNSENRGFASRVARANRRHHGFAHRIEGARADIAVDDADRAQRQGQEARPGARLAMCFGGNSAAAFCGGNRGPRNHGAPGMLQCNIELRL